jgi:hypothetical protein
LTDTGNRFKVGDCNKKILICWRTHLHDWAKEVAEMLLECHILLMEEQVVAGGLDGLEPHVIVLVGEAPQQHLLDNLHILGLCRAEQLFKKYRYYFFLSLKMKLKKIY